MVHSLVVAPGTQWEVGASFQGVVALRSSGTCFVSAFVVLGGVTLCPFLTSIGFDASFTSVAIFLALIALHVLAGGESLLHSAGSVEERQVRETGILNIP